MTTLFQTQLKKPEHKFAIDQSHPHQRPPQRLITLVLVPHPSPLLPLSRRRTYQWLQSQELHFQPVCPRFDSKIGNDLASRSSHQIMTNLNQRCTTNIDKPAIALDPSHLHIHLMNLPFHHEIRGQTLIPALQCMLLIRSILVRDINLPDQR